MKYRSSWTLLDVPVLAQCLKGVGAKEEREKMFQSHQDWKE
jgi:hypothetical protein